MAQGERNLILVVTTIFSLERPTGFNRSHQKKTLDSCHMVNGGTTLFQRARGCPIILGQRERNCLVNEKNNRHVFRHFSASPFLFFPPLFSSSSFSFPLFSLWSGPLVSTGRTKKLPRIQTRFLPHGEWRYCTIPESQRLPGFPCNEGKKLLYKRKK